VGIGLDIHAGIPERGNIAPKRAQRHSEPALIVLDGDRIAAHEPRREPDDANDAPGFGFNSTWIGCGKAPPGGRRGRVELRVCHSVGLSIG